MKHVSTSQEKQYTSADSAAQLHRWRGGRLSLHPCQVPLHSGDLRHNAMHRDEARQDGLPQAKHRPNRVYQMHTRRAHPATPGAMPQQVRSQRQTQHKQHVGYHDQTNNTLLRSNNEPFNDTATCTAIDVCKYIRRSSEPRADPPLPRREAPPPLHPCQGPQHRGILHLNAVHLGEARHDCICPESGIGPTA